MQRTIRLETNDESVMQCGLKFFRHHQDGKSGQQDFLWRVAREPDPSIGLSAVPLTAFSDSGLRQVNIGQRSFLAVDLRRREGIGYLADGFFEGNARLRHRPPIDVLLCLTAASLGLTTLSGGCVSAGNKGVLVFGPPNSGKTTACYLAANAGAQFQADQVVFLDLTRNGFRVWGDPFPAVFRPQTLDFLPQLRRAGHYSNYGDLSFYYFDKSPLQSLQANAITPVCSLFLDRSTGCGFQLKEMPKRSAVARLREHILLEEDSRFDGQVQDGLTALSEAGPSYHLRFDTDPKIAADVIGKLLR